MTAAVPAVAVAAAETSAIAERRPGAVAALVRNPVAVICAAYLFLLVIALVCAPLLAPYSPNVEDLGHVLAGPSLRHWLGTDQLGRDVTSRLMYGGRSSLGDVLVATATFLIAGVPLGLLAGYQGGVVDRMISRAADLLFALPAIVILLMVVAVLPNNDLVAMITLGIIASPGLLRVIRGTTLAVRQELFVRAAQLSGLRTAAVLRRHVVPSLIGPIIVQGSLCCAGALIAESGLSFLGLLRPDTTGPTWGNMVSDAAGVLGQDTWLLVPTGGIIALTVMAFSLLGDAVRDATVGRSIGSVPLVRQLTTPAAASNVPQPSAGHDDLLAVDRLTVALGDVRLVTNVSLSVRAGEAVGIVGESGCGKTVTARAVLGLLPPGGSVASGSVRFDEQELTTLTEKQLNHIRGAGIALISQDAVSSLDPTYTVGSQICEVIRHHSSIPRRAAQERAVELLEMVSLPEPRGVLRLRPHQLSGGMAQRVGIAIALAAGPRLLIADEPTTALDATVQREVLELLADLRRRLDMALILVTHDWGVLAEVCERALVMYAGEIVEEASVQTLCLAPRHPYSAALLAANPQLAPPGHPLPTITGRVPPPSAWPAGCRFAPRCSRATAECTAQQIQLEGTADSAVRCLHPVLQPEPA
ncbi:MAG TPA: dipeptide/oligopeptide/nickel ABC transporter permease/ATP-binding protein [Streptosporangiaceae bacterium]|nr:dipeptide/oligopeptide/nickel ABC transporter permease/ATP-binding protein [Streptosporangiaceae bacterium]